MSNLVASIGIVILLEFVAFAILYKLTQWTGKQVAFTVIVVTLAIFIPVGVMNWSSLDRFAIHFAFYVMIPYVLGIITSHWEIRREVNKADNKKWFHWAPATLVTFFLILAVVDATIITIAEKGVPAEIMARFFPVKDNDSISGSKFSGTVPHDFQEKEALFNAYLKKRKAQQARGWKVRKGWLQKAVAGEEKIFQVMIEDVDGKPVSEAEINGQFFRPADHSLDQTFVMQEIGAGLYQVRMTLPKPGLWSLVMIIEREDEWHEVRAKTTVQVPG